MSGLLPESVAADLANFFNRNRICILAEMYPKPTDEQRAETERRREAVTAAAPGWIARLKATQNRVARAVLEVHAIGEYGDCNGCMDEMGQEWPCRTVDAVAEALSDPTPADMWLIGQKEMRKLCD